MYQGVQRTRRSISPEQEISLLMNKVKRYTKNSDACQSRSSVQKWDSFVGISEKIFIKKIGAYQKSSSVAFLWFVAI